MRGGRYDFDKICCRTRYILTEPREEVKQAWLAIWARKFGQAIDPQDPNWLKYGRHDQIGRY